MSEKSLSTKNPEGKWWTYGRISTNQFGNEQVSFKLDNLKLLVEQAEAMNKEWVNLSIFEKKEKQNAHYEAKANGYQPQEVNIPDDDIPF